MAGDGLQQGPGPPEGPLAAEVVVSGRPWREAGKAFRAWLRRWPRGGVITLVAGQRIDPLAGAIILRRALVRAGYRPVLVTSPAVAAGEQGVAETGGVGPVASPCIVLGTEHQPPGRPGDGLLVIDHRPVVAVMAGGALIGAADWRPPISTAVLTYWLAQGITNVGGLDWVAALGAMVEQGERSTLPLVIAAKRAYGSEWLRQLAGLCLAAQRAAPPPIAALTGLLVAASDPRRLLTSERPELERLRRVRDEVEVAIEAALRRMPLVDGPAVVIELQAAGAIEAVVADIWAGRRPGRLVLVGNRGRLPGRVAVLARGVADDGGLERLVAALPASFRPARPERAAEQLLSGWLAEADWSPLLERLFGAENLSI